MKVVGVIQENRKFLVEVDITEIASFSGTRYNTYPAHVGDIRVIPGAVFEISEVYKEAHDVVAAYRSIKGSIANLEVAAKVVLGAMEHVAPRKENT